MSREQKKHLYGFGLPVILGTILLLSISYAWLSLTLTGTKTNVLKAGTLSLKLTDSTSSEINMTGAVPMMDEVGLTTNPYTFTLTNNGDINSEYTIYLDNVALNTGETQLPDTTIKYNLVKDNVSMATALLSTLGTNPNRILDSGIIAPGDTYTYDLRLWLDQNATIAQAAGKVFRGKIRVVAQQIIEDPRAAQKSILANRTIKEPIDGMFGTPYSGEGIFTAPDDYGTSYYFRGIGNRDNYLTFAGKTWRIIRINGDGTVRIMLDAEEITSVYLSDYADNAYLGYKYTKGEQHGTSTDGFLKTKVDQWYKTNLSTFANYLADAVFCNDRTTTSGTGIGNSSTVYSAAGRLTSTTKAPILTCPDKRDAFTVNDTTKGNGELDYPIGLITADELNMAGAVNGQVVETLLSPLSNYWTMTPCGYDASSPGLFSNYDKKLSVMGVNNSMTIHPVVNLKANLKLTGNGTSGNPYKIAS